MSDETFHITIDGEAAETRTGETLLTVCRLAGKDIPTLCHHAAIEPYAACRVCLVAVVGARGTAMVPSCQYPVTDGLVIETDSDDVKSARKIVLELLLARCPNSDVIRELAAILRVANALDRSHSPRAIELGVAIEDGRLIINAESTRDLTMERHRVQDRSEMFRQVYGMDIVLRRAAGRQRDATT